MAGYLYGGNATLPPAEEQYIYGVKWTKASTSSALTRTGSSTNYTFTPQKVASGAVTQTGSSSFDAKPVYKDIRRCNVVNGIVTAYEGEAGFSMTPAAGDVMVEIPKFYYSVTNSDTELEIKLSDKNFDGAHVSPLHLPTAANLDGEEKAYISAYFLDSAGRSSGGESAKNSSISFPASWPNGDYGNGYIPSGIMTFATILLLYLVEVADFDSQSAVCDVGFSTAMDINGQSGTLGYHSGGDDSAGWCVYRGMENLWGKTPTELFGVLLFNGLNLIYRESAWSNNAVEASAPMPLGVVAEEGETSTDTGSGFIVDFEPDEEVPGILIPTTTASAAKGIPDYYATSGLGSSLYLRLYWGAVTNVPAAPTENENTETSSVAVESDLIPLGSGGILSLVSALDMDCFYRLTYLPGLSQRQTYTATFTERDGTPITTQAVPVFFPFAAAPEENPNWEKGLFTGWQPDPRIAITHDTVFQPQFVLGQKKKIPVLGRYDTLEALQAAVTSPTQGDLYEVGTEEPYKVYIYVTTDGWVDTLLRQ